MNTRVLAVTCLLASACHDIVALPPPPGGGGRTGLWVISRSDQVVQGRVACEATSSEATTADDGDGGSRLLEPCLEVRAFALTPGARPRVPAFARRGVVHLGYVELACSLELMGIEEGPLALRTKPHEVPQFPRAVAAHTLRTDQEGWVTADARDGWLGAALLSVETPPRLKCRTRGVEMTGTQLPARTVQSLAPLRGGDVLMVAVEGSARYADTNMSQRVTLSSTFATSLVGAAYVDDADRLWLIETTGGIYRAPFAIDFIAPRVGRIREAPWGRAVAAGADAFFTSTDIDVANADRDTGARVAVARYDRRTDRWDELVYTETRTDGARISFTDILPLDAERVVVSGADGHTLGIGELNLIGSGRLLEVSRTSSTWVPLVTNAGARAFVVGLFESATYGPLAGAIACRPTGPCVDAREGVTGVIFRRVGETWSQLPEISLDFAPFAIADAGPRGLWLGGLRTTGRQGEAGLRAVFDDGLSCQVEGFSQSVTRLQPIGDRGFVVIGYSRLTQTQTLMTPGVVEEACLASAFDPPGG